MTRPRAPDDGFTLLEMLVALALLALISLGALSVLSSLVQAHERTQGTIEQLSSLQRASFLVGRDLEQALDLAYDGQVLALRRNRTEGPPLRIGYQASGDALVRAMGDRRSVQVVLRAPAAVHWRFLALDGVWRERWTALDGHPRAVELRLGFPVPPGAAPIEMRRVFLLPAAP